MHNWVSGPRDLDPYIYDESRYRVTINPQILSYGRSNLSMVNGVSASWVFSFFPTLRAISTPLQPNMRFSRQCLIWIYGTSTGTGFQWVHCCCHISWIESHGYSSCDMTSSSEICSFWEHQCAYMRSCSIRAIAGFLQLSSKRLA